MKKPDPEIKLSLLDYRANYSALLYIITEQQVLLGRLIEELIRVGAIDNASLNRITAGRNDIDVLAPIYGALYKDFADYFVRVKWALQEMEKEKQDGTGTEEPKRED